MNVRGLNCQKFVLLDDWCPTVHHNDRWSFIKSTHQNLTNKHRKHTYIINVNIYFCREAPNSKEVKGVINITWFNFPF